MINTFASTNKHREQTKILDDRELVGETYESLKGKVAAADRQLAEVEKKGEDEYKKAFAIRAEWEQSKRLALAATGNAILWERYMILWERHKSARRAVLWGIALAAAGMALFAWGANPPDDEKKAAPVALGQAPLPLHLHLTAAGCRRAQGRAQCSTTDFNVLSIGGTADKREVVTVPDNKCNTVRFGLDARPRHGQGVEAAPPPPKAKPRRPNKKPTTSTAKTTSTP